MTKGPHAIVWLAFLSLSANIATAGAVTSDLVVKGHMKITDRFTPSFLGYDDSFGRLLVIWET